MGEFKRKVGEQYLQGMRALREDERLLAPTIFFSDPLTLFFSSTIKHRGYDHGREAAA